METPTIKRKKGKIKSANVQPSQAACWRGGKTWSQSPASFTRIMPAMVRPRKASSESNRSLEGGSMESYSTANTACYNLKCGRPQSPLTPVSQKLPPQLPLLLQAGTQFLKLLRRPRLVEGEELVAPGKAHDVATHDQHLRGVLQKRAPFHVNLLRGQGEGNPLHLFLGKTLWRVQVRPRPPAPVERPLPEVNQQGQQLRPGLGLAVGVPFLQRLQRLLDVKVRGVVIGVLVPRVSRDDESGAKIG